MSQNVTQGLRIWRIVWKDLDNVKWKSRLNSVNACNYFVQSLLSSRLRYKILKSGTSRPQFYAWFFYECETWPLTKGKT
jgi:hypothetical protein